MAGVGLSAMSAQRVMKPNSVYSLKRHGDCWPTRVDWGITPKALKVEMAPPSARTLLSDATAGPAPRRLVAHPRILKSSTGLLYDAMAGVYASLGFDDAAGDEVFRELVIARVVEPTSLLDVDRPWPSRAVSQHHCRAANPRGDLGEVTTGTGTAQGMSAWRSTTSPSPTSRPITKNRCARSTTPRNAALTRRSLSTCWSTGTDSRRQSAALKAIKAETLTIGSTVKAFQPRHDTTGMVVADAGMLAATNLRELDDAGFRFIVGSRITKAPNDLASHIHWHGTVFTDRQIIDTITPRDQHGAAAAKTSDLKVKAEPVSGPRKPTRSRGGRCRRIRSKGLCGKTRC
jgi:hypothetical protein